MASWQDLLARIGARHEQLSPVSMEHTLITWPDAAQLAVKAAGFVADRIRSAIMARGAFTFAVSGGQTPWPCSPS